MKKSICISHEEKIKLLESFEKLLVGDYATALRVKSGKVELLDQRRIPKEEIWLPCDTVEQMYIYIKRLSTRGAPLIGCSAAIALAVHTLNQFPNDPKIPETADYLRSSRPTAVNLMYACDLISQRNKTKPDYSPQHICKIAYDIIKHEIDMCENMANGANLIKSGENIITHCNTGSLATPGLGTALGVIKKAHSMGKKIHVYVDETRPLLQGGRLTTWELERAHIPYTLICDNMAAVLMQRGVISRALVGADRIALNGDFANKIGTYSLAVNAKHHGVPFHPVAPLSTVDFDCPNGGAIPIEERIPEEVQGAFGTKWAPPNAPVFNPAFDVTPTKLVTSMILDTGVYSETDLNNGALSKLNPSRKSKL